MPPSLLGGRTRPGAPRAPVAAANTWRSRPQRACRTHRLACRAHAPDAGGAPPAVAAPSAASAGAFPPPRPQPQPWPAAQPPPAAANVVSSGAGASSSGGSTAGGGAAPAAAPAPAPAPAAPAVAAPSAVAVPTAAPNGGANGAGAAANGSLARPYSDYGALHKSDYGKFVQFFRQASPYIEGHRGRTFVIVIPGEVVREPGLLQALMADIGLLHGLGARLVVVLGAQPQIDAALRERGEPTSFIGSYRITDEAALEAAVEAAGRSRTAVEQFLSRGPCVPVFRRHVKSDAEMHFGPALSVVSGNYVAAKRRGVVDGVDFGYTGEVRFVNKDAIAKQLGTGNIVLLSNLGFTAAGEVLNCNTYDVGLHAAVELGADKLFCLHLDDVRDLQLPQWLPLSDARAMLLRRLMGQPPAESSLNADEADRLRLLLLGEAEDAGGWDGRNLRPADDEDGPRAYGERPGSRSGSRASSRSGSRAGSRSGSRAGAPDRQPAAAGAGASADAGPAAAPRYDDYGEEGGGYGGYGASTSGRDFMLNLDLWRDQGFPTAVSVSVVACSRGVKRSHLVDARIDGGMLLELYSRDGIGTMISTDFYEGIRQARSADLEAVQALLAPLERAGVLVARTREELRALIYNFYVLERETKVMGCALLLPLGESPDGERVAEIGAFCVDPVFRGSGRGDSLLDFVEQDARAKGMGRLVLLTTRTADWFSQRDFQLAGPAWSSELLPEARRARINPARNAQLYCKELVPLAEGDPMRGTQPGKRIGF